jgi:hypothetical protein
MGKRSRFIKSGDASVVSTRRHGPIILRDTAPEEPHADDGQETEERLEQCPVDFTVERIADMRADNKVEDLSKGEKDCCSGEVD